MGTATNKSGKRKRAADRKPGRATTSKKKAKAPAAAERKPSQRGQPAGAERPAATAAASRRPTKKSSPTPNIVIDADVLEFIAALDAFKAQHGRPFPSWSEVLHVLRELGYRKH